MMGRGRGCLGRGNCGCEWLYPFYNDGLGSMKSMEESVLTRG